MYYSLFLATTILSNLSLHFFSSSLSASNYTIRHGRSKIEQFLSAKIPYYNVSQTLSWIDRLPDVIQHKKQQTRGYIRSAASRKVASTTEPSSQLKKQRIKAPPKTKTRKRHQKVINCFRAREESATGGTQYNSAA